MKNNSCAAARRREKRKKKSKKDFSLAENLYSLVGGGGAGVGLVRWKRGANRANLSNTSNNINGANQTRLCHLKISFVIWNSSSLFPFPFFLFSYTNKQKFGADDELDAKYMIGRD